MHFENKNIKIDDDILVEIVRVAKEVFGNFIFVPSDEHPCGWDTLSFDEIEEYDEILEYKFDHHDISNGCYSNHEYEGKTLREILVETKNKFEFER